MSASEKTAYPTPEKALHLRLPPGLMRVYCDYPALQATTNPDRATCVDCLDAYKAQALGNTASVVDDAP